ncbi:hypothetical protein ACFVUY_08260 [Kitasatospora sp. NPDC058063]|uniref:hypothetical protein n=1 Tax=unclassified Kitasatospora TaxID=2633591 RepID=UPI0036DD2998
MRTPGFTADAAVYRSRGHYRPGPSRGGPARANVLVPSARAGRGSRSVIDPICIPECRGACFPYCVRDPLGRKCRDCMSDCYALCPPYPSA